MDLSKLEELLNEGVSIYLDTNCLLDLYSYPKRVTDEFILGFKKFLESKDVEIRISSFVKKEFERNQKTKKKEKLKTSIVKLNATSRIFKL